MHTTSSLYLYLSQLMMKKYGFQKKKKKTMTNMINDWVNYKNLYFKFHGMTLSQTLLFT